MMKRVHVLLIEDNDDHARLIQVMLQDSTGQMVQFELTCVAQLAAGLERLTEGGVDVVLLDLFLPDSRGLDTFTRLHALAPAVPVVVLSGLDNQELATRAVGQGAQDYLVKSEINPQLLTRAVRYALERSRAEAALRESEERFRHLVEQAADAFFVFDRHGRILDANRRACASLGYTRDELLQLSLPDIEEGLVPEGVAELWAHLVPGQPITLDAVHRRKGGTSFPVETRIGLFEFRGRQLLLALVRDTTGRRWAEEALRQYTVELGARNEELDAFAHTVAHDLKCPLGYIVGFAHVLEEEYDSLPADELRHYLHTIARSGHKMGQIIDELLVLAGVGKMAQVPLDWLDMASVVAAALERLTPMLTEHRVEVVLPQTWPAALGYAPWVEEVWVNYLTNAIKYGGRPPRIQLGAESGGNGSARFWVSDNGSGLEPEAQQRLFVPFEQLHLAHAKGHGLGLSIVRRIIERLHGGVGVESQVGKGSLFYFTLPVATAK